MYLGEIAHIFSGRPAKRPADGDTPHVARVVGLRDISRRISPLSDLEAVEIADGEDVARSALRPGDVVVTSRGSNVRAAVAQREHDGVLAGPNLIVVRLEGEVPPELIAAYLRHPLISAQLLREFVGTSTAGFTIESLKRIELARTDDRFAVLLAELVVRVDAYAEYQQRVIALREKAADESIFFHLHPDGQGPAS